MCATLASGTRPDRGRPGSKPSLKAGVSPACGPGFGHVGQGIKKPGKPRPQGQPGLALPWLAGAKIEKEKQKT